MKHLSKWFIATLAGVALFSSSCVDQVKFGDSFLEKAPGVAVTQDTIFGKATYARASCGILIVNFITRSLYIGIRWRGK